MVRTISTCKIGKPEQIHEVLSKSENLGWSGAMLDGEIMPFEKGRAYTRKDGKLQAVVVETRSGGREGRLRIDGKGHGWALSADGEWQLMEGK